MARAPKRHKPPLWLDDLATEEWKRVEKLLREEEKDFTLKDLKALEAYCVNYSKWKRAEETLLREGHAVRCDSGYEQQRPEVAIAFKAQQEFRAWARELGLTPGSRAKMYKVPVSKEDVDEEMEDMVSK